jgi:hypothetical protein
VVLFNERADDRFRHVACFGDACDPHLAQSSRFSGSHFVWRGGSVTYSWLSKHDFRVIGIIFDFVA